MKKRNLTLALVAAVVAGAGLTACSSEPLSASKTGAILTISGANNLEINVEDIFNKYLLKSSGISAYYDALCEVVIRSEVEVTEKISETAKREVNAKKDQAKETAKNNGTSYDDALDDILESENVSDLDELYDKEVYKGLKEEAETSYLDGHAQELLSDYIQQMVPYHISHILVKVSAAANDGGYSGQITAQEARNLGAAVSMIAQGRLSFGTIAQKMSEDGSATSYGELGIMDTSTNYVPEFKLGLYAYDKFFNQTANKDEDRLARLNITDAAEEYYSTHSMVKIPYDKIMEMASDEIADKVTDDKGRLVNDGDANFYPRNIYFNHLFNSHQIGLITTTSANMGENFYSDDPEKGVPELANVLDDGEYALCTEDKKPIIVVRSGSGDSYQGIHFIAINKNPITNTLDSLKEYYDYTQTIPTYSENANTGKYFVSFHANTNQVYHEAVDKLKDTVEGFDKMIDSRIFRNYLENGKNKYKINPEIKVTSESGIEITLEQAIYNYMDNTKAANEANTKEGLEKNWNEYIEQMQVFDENRKGHRNAATEEELGRMVDFTCAAGFGKAYESADYKEGGLCYAKK